MTLQPIDPTSQPAIDENGVPLDPDFVARETAVDGESGDTGRSDVEDDDDAETVESPDVDDDGDPTDDD